MGYFFAMVIGYFIGARAGSKDLDQLSESVRALRESEEFGDLVAAARSHAGHTLRELAGLVDGSAARNGDGRGFGSDLLDGFGGVGGSTRRAPAEPAEHAVGRDGGVGSGERENRDA